MRQNWWSSPPCHSQLSQTDFSLLVPLFPQCKMGVQISLKRVGRRAKQDEECAVPIMDCGPQQASINGSTPLSPIPWHQTTFKSFSLIGERGAAMAKHKQSVRPWAESWVACCWIRVGAEGLWGCRLALCGVTGQPLHFRSMCLLTIQAETPRDGLQSLCPAVHYSLTGDNTTAR